MSFADLRIVMPDIWASNAVSKPNSPEETCIKVNYVMQKKIHVIIFLPLSGDWHLFKTNQKVAVYLLIKKIRVKIHIFPHWVNAGLLVFFIFMLFLKINCKNGSSPLMSWKISLFFVNILILKTVLYQFIKCTYI